VNDLVDFNELIQAISHSVMVFIMLVILFRFIGKKFLAQMTFFDFVTGITIGTIGGANPRPAKRPQKKPALTFNTPRLK